MIMIMKLVSVLKYALRTRDPLYRYWFFQFYYAAFAVPLQSLSKILPDSDAAIDELLSFQVEMQVFSISTI